MTIADFVTRQLSVAPYLVDVLMRDLAGHDRSPSAFIVYLWLWRHSRGEGRESVGASLQTIATHTGRSKSAVQAAVGRLKQRGLVEGSRRHQTDAPIYTVHEPWVQPQAVS